VQRKASAISRPAQLQYHHFPLAPNGGKLLHFTRTFQNFDGKIKVLLIDCNGFADSKDESEREMPSQVDSSRLKIPEAGYGKPDSATALCRAQPTVHTDDGITPRSGL
jgi:hypothetical protein